MRTSPMPYLLSITPIEC